MYNLTTVWAANATHEQMAAVNNLSGGWFIGLMMFALYMIILMRASRTNIRVTLLVTSFVELIVGILFFTLGLIGLPVLIIPIILLFVSFVIYLFT